MAVIDPYRTLGLAPGATTADVKAAYRRLAKRYHPDQAGPAAVARFLEVQHAYEMLMTGRLSRALGRPRPAHPASRSRPQAPSGRPERPRAEWPRAERPRAERPRDERPGPERPRGEPPNGERSRTPRRKATLGSTSYDEATVGPLDGDWRGASWYGTDSGTYWTVNPREYADPRKHGPEYQERARRATNGPVSTAPAAGSPIGRSSRPEPPAAPTWSAAGTSVESVAGSPHYPGIAAIALAAGGLILGLLMLVTLFARP